MMNVRQKMNGHYFPGRKIEVFLRWRGVVQEERREPDAGGWGGGRMSGWRPLRRG